MKKIFIALSVVSSMCIGASYADDTKENAHQLQVLNNLLGDAAKLNPPRSDVWDNVQMLAVKANLACGEIASNDCKAAVLEATNAVRDFSSQDINKSFDANDRKADAAKDTTAEKDTTAAKETKSVEQTEIDRAMIKRFQAIAKKFNELKDVPDPRVKEFEKAARATSNACKMFPAKAEACEAATVNAEEVYDQYFNIVINEKKPE